MKFRDVPVGTKFYAKNREFRKLNNNYDGISNASCNKTGLRVCFPPDYNVNCEGTEQLDVSPIQD